MIHGQLLGCTRLREKPRIVAGTDTLSQGVPPFEDLGGRRLRKETSALRLRYGRLPDALL